MYLWIILTILMFFGLRFLEGTAAMRGTKGKDSFSSFSKKLLRAAFLLFVFFPVFSFSYSFSVYLFFPLLFLFTLYLPTFCDLSELNGGRPSPFLKKLPTWKWIRKYFPLKVEGKGVLPPGKYIICVHPHGILPFGGLTNLLADFEDAKHFLQNIQSRTLAASFCFYIPGYRDFLLGAGVCDAARYSANRLLSKGFSIILVPGGATEALYSDPKEDVLYLRSRKGFVKLALSQGADLVPVFSFNENGTYHQLSSKIPAVLYVKKKFQSIFGLSLPLITNLIPRRVPITTVIGKPIKITKKENPSDKEVEEVLELYIKELQELYDEFKDKYNSVPKKLTII